MIKIIRAGEPQKGTIETFECIYCGCIWKASDEDVFVFADEKQEIRCVCYCPSCHEMAWIGKAGDQKAVIEES